MFYKMFSSSKSYLPQPPEKVNHDTIMSDSVTIDLPDMYVVDGVESMKETLWRRLIWLGDPI